MGAAVLVNYKTQSRTHTKYTHNKTVSEKKIRSRSVVN